MPNDTATADGATTSQPAAPAPAPTPAPAADAAAPASAPAPAPSPAPADLLLGGDAPAAEAPAEKPAEGEVEKPAEEAPPGAPEAYADFTMPDGVTLNGEVADSFKAWAKEHNLPQDKAQQVAALGAQLVQDVQSKQVAAIQEQIDGWKIASTTDKEFGGDRLNENLAVANKALTTFGSPDLVKMLKETGLGNHPEVIRMLVNVGKQVSEDGFSGGKPGSTPQQSNTAQRMYPNMNP